MQVKQVEGEIDGRFTSAEATPTPWDEAREVLSNAEVYWLSTVRPDGRPHVTPLIALWLDDALYFCTGADERKAKNMASNQHCVITTGCNKMGEGLDVVVEGDAVKVSDQALLKRLADAWVAKYGEEWRFTVRDGTFVGAEGNVALVFEVAPRKALGFGKGETFSQTRWRF